MEVQSNYQKNKVFMENWRKNNQEHVNKYHRDKRAEIKRLKTLETNKQIALEYIQQMLVNKN